MTCEKTKAVSGGRSGPFPETVLSGDDLAEKLGERLASVVRQTILAATDTDMLILELRERVRDLSDELRARIDQHDREIERLAASERQLMDALESARAQNRAIRSSTSWKVSAPIRVVGSALRRTLEVMQSMKSRRPENILLAEELRRIDPEPRIRDAWESLVLTLKQ